MALTQRDKLLKGATINVAPFLEVLLVIFVVLIVVSNLSEPLINLDTSDIDTKNNDFIKNEIIVKKLENEVIDKNVEDLKKQLSQVAQKSELQKDIEVSKIFDDIERIKNQIEQLKLGFSRNNFLYFFFDKKGNAYLNGIEIPVAIAAQIPKNYSKDYLFYFLNDGSDVGIKNSKIFSKFANDFGFISSSGGTTNSGKIIKNAFGE